MCPKKLKLIFNANFGIFNTISDWKIIQCMDVLIYVAIVLFLDFYVIPHILLL